MLSHALPMYELHRQELLLEAANERRLDQLVLAGVSETRGGHHRLADLGQRVVTALVSLRAAAQLPSHAAAN